MAMKILYDDDAVAIFDEILKGLSDLGYRDVVSDVHCSLLETEGDIERMLESALQLLHDGDVTSAMRILFANPSSPDGISEAGHRFSEESDPADLRGALLYRVADWLAHGYEPNAPLNTLEAMFGLFRVVVLNARCFDAASKEARKLGKELVICDETGEEVFGEAKRAQLSNAEDEFWGLFTQMIERWDCRFLLDRRTEETASRSELRTGYERPRAQLGMIYAEWPKGEAA